MPELPEVETIVRQLRPLIDGRTVRRFEAFDPRLELSAADCTRLEQRRISGVERLGKQIVLSFTASDEPQNPLWLCIHLRMTGRLLWAQNGSEPAAPPLRAHLILDRGRLLFKDVRRFGTMRVVHSLAQAQPAGLDPLTRAFTTPALARMMRGVKTPVKPWLLRQDRIVGIGNIYASEALFEAAIHPQRPAGSLSPDEINRLRAAIRAVLRRAVRAGGTTFSDFQNLRGDIGNYQHNLHVYDHAGDPCPRCTTPIQRLVQHQRGTFFCPQCQS